MDKAQKMGQMLNNSIDRAVEQFQKTLPDIEFEPEIDDRKVKQAILDITPDALQGLFARFGQKEVIDFINQFSQGRRW